MATARPQPPLNFDGLQGTDPDNPSKFVGGLGDADVEGAAVGQLAAMGFGQAGELDVEGEGLLHDPRAMGADGFTIDQLSDVGPALSAATKAQSQGKSTVLEMMVTRELGDPFRRDALALPTRHLAKYKATAAR